MKNHDKLIIKILISGPRHLPNTRRIQKINKGLCPNIMTYLRNRYTDIHKNCKLSEIIYRIYFGQEKRNYCKTCGKETNFDIKGYKFYGHPYLYANFCCNKCAQNNEITKEKLRQTCLKRYGVINGGASKEAKEKIRQTNLKKRGVTNNMLLNSFKEQRKKTWKKKYGVDHPLKCKEIQNKIVETCLIKYNSTWTSNNDISKLKRHQTNTNKYGVEENLSSSEIKEKIKETFKRKYNCDSIGQLAQSNKFKEIRKETLLLKYSVDNPLKIPSIREKLFHSNIQKGRCSKKENELYNILLAHFNKNDIIRQYKDVIRYPYFCDFYIKSIDTYIEYQGTWLHGKHPYNEKDINDFNLVKFWKSKDSNYYNQGIKCWTIRDREKRTKAIQSNIRYVEIFSIENVDFNEIKNNLKNKYIVYL